MVTMETGGSPQPQGSPRWQQWEQRVFQEEPLAGRSLGTGDPLLLGPSRKLPHPFFKVPGPTGRSLETELVPGTASDQASQPLGPPCPNLQNQQVPAES